VAVSKSEHLPEDGQVMPKHVAVYCDLNGNLRRDCEQSCIKDGSECVDSHSYSILHFTYPHQYIVIHIIYTIH
jgi:hypothetical protein